MLFPQMQEEASCFIQLLQGCLSSCWHNECPFLSQDSSLDIFFKCSMCKITCVEMLHVNVLNSNFMVTWFAAENGPFQLQSGQWLRCAAGKVNGACRRCSTSLALGQCSGRPGGALKRQRNARCFWTSKQVAMLCHVICCFFPFLKCVYIILFMLLFAMTWIFLWSILGNSYPETDGLSKALEVCHQVSMEHTKWQTN